MTTDPILEGTTPGPHEWGSCCHCCTENADLARRLAETEELDVQRVEAIDLLAGNLAEAEAENERMRRTIAHAEYSLKAYEISLTRAETLIGELTAALELFDPQNHANNICGGECCKRLVPALRKAQEYQEREAAPGQSADESEGL